MDSRNRLLHLLVFYYNGAHHGIAVCLNVMALAVLGASWRKIGKLQDVRLPYFMSIFICGLNIIFLISVELPKLYSEWTEEPNLFSVRVCLYLSVAVPISEVAQTIVIMWAIVGICASICLELVTFLKKMSSVLGKCLKYDSGLRQMLDHTQWSSICLKPLSFFEILVVIGKCLLL